MRIFRFILRLLTDVLIYAFVSFFVASTSMSLSAINIPLIVFFGAQAFLFVLFALIKGLYRNLDDSFGAMDALLIGAVSLSIGIVAFFANLSFDWGGRADVLPRLRIGAMILGTVSEMFLLAGVRFAPRAYKSVASTMYKKNRRTFRTLVIGAGSAAKIVVDEAIKNRENRDDIVAFIDDNPAKIGGTYSRRPVFGPLETIHDVILKERIEQVVIAIAHISKERLGEILALLREENVRVRRLPIISEDPDTEHCKTFDVDINELLGREVIKVDNSAMKEMLGGKCVMVTGAGGSIGSELTRQIFAVHPKTLVLFDIYENSTYDIQMELTRKIRNGNITDIELVTLIGSTYNEKRVEQVIRKYRPEYIYHAAAYKHVPLMEDSPAEAIRANVIGTYNVARLADKYGVKKITLVSTDKAVRPTNTMGATKRFAETIIQYFSSKSEHTQYSAVRFGNVLDSNGSVIPLFKKQIEEGGPVTVTHPDIIRYFMTIPEAVSLILQSSIYATGGEIFILDMGKPVKIVTLAERLIRQAGLVPYQDIKIEFTGLRPGEKLYEELLIANHDEHRKTDNPKIFIEKASEIYPIEQEVVDIARVFDMEDNNDIKNMLKTIITTYKSPEEVNGKI